MSAADQKVLAAEEAFKEAKAASIARWHADPVYLAEKQDVEVKRQAKSDARENGTPQERLDTDSAFNLARMKLDSDEKVALLPNPEILAAQQNLADAVALRDRSEVEARQKEAQRIQEAKDADEKQRAIQARAVFGEVTFNQLNTLGERFVKKRVSIHHFIFEEADNSWVKNLPGVTISEDGLITVVDSRAENTWIGFFGGDDDQGMYQFFFASKAIFGDLIASLKRGTRISVVGYVVPLTTNNWYGLVCDHIEIGP